MTSPALSSPAVTVIIPVFNGASHVREAIESVLAQRFQTFELIVVDDCSTDGTAAIVQTLARRDSRVRLLRLDVNAGPSACRNRAVVLCQAPLIAFLDADDTWTADHLELCLETLRASPDYALVCCEATIGNDRAAERISPTAIDYIDRAALSLLGSNFVVQSTVVVRKPNFLEVGGYAETLRYAEDFDLWTRLAAAGCRMAHVHRATCRRGSHAEQVSGRNRGSMLQSAWITRSRALLVALDAGESAEHCRSALEHAAREDLLGAWNARDRHSMQVVLKCIEELPVRIATPARFSFIAGWQWRFWRVIAAVYDRTPSALRLSLRRWVSAR